MDLGKTEINTLLAIEKYLTDPKSVCIPEAGGTEKFSLRYHLRELDHDDMHVSAYKGKKDPRKASYRLIYAGNIILIRVDLGDRSPHINPDGEIIPAMTPHIHIFREGFEDRTAYPLPSEFKDSNDLIQSLKDFLSYAKVMNVSEVEIRAQEVLPYE